MIGFIRGELIDKTENSVLVDVNNVGFEIFVTQKTAMEVTEKVFLYTYLQVKDDDLVLFGFLSKQEKAMFLKLITVSGIGPKMAISIMSGISISDLAFAIINGDTKLLSTIKGLGKKTAERLVLELKEKVEPIDENDFNEVQDEHIVTNTAMTDAAFALTALGISKNEALMLVRSVATSDDTAESLIEKVLKTR